METFRIIISYGGGFARRHNGATESEGSRRSKVRVGAERGRKGKRRHWQAGRVRGQGERGSSLGPGQSGVAVVSVWPGRGARANHACT